MLRCAAGGYNTGKDDAEDPNFGAREDIRYTGPRNVSPRWQDLAQEA